MLWCYELRGKTEQKRQPRTQEMKALEVHNETMSPVMAKAKLKKKGKKKYKKDYMIHLFLISPEISKEQ